MKELISIGKIIKPRGVKGEVTVKNFSRWYEPIYEAEHITVFRGTEKFELEIESIRKIGDTVSIKFKGIDSRKKALEFRGAELKMPADKLPKLSNDEFYVFDVIGLKVITFNGRLIGEVVDIINNPGNDLIVIEDTEGKEVIIPSVKAIIEEIDISKRTILLKEDGELY